MGGNLRGGYVYRAGDTTQADFRAVLQYAVPNTNSLSWVAITQGVRIQLAGVIRVSFTLYINHAESGLRVGYACIEKNGTRVGTVRSVVNTTPVLFTEDISVAPGDVIKIQGYQSSNVGDFQGVFLSSAKISVANPTNSFV